MESLVIFFVLICYSEKNFVPLRGQRYRAFASLALKLAESPLRFTLSINRNSSHFSLAMINGEKLAFLIANQEVYQV